MFGWMCIYVIRWLFIMYLFVCRWTYLYTYWCKRDLFTDMWNAYLGTIMILMLVTNLLICVYIYIFKYIYIEACTYLRIHVLTISIWPRTHMFTLAHMAKRNGNEERCEKDGGGWKGMVDEGRVDTVCLCVCGGMCGHKCWQNCLTPSSSVCIRIPIYIHLCT